MSTYNKTNKTEPNKLKKVAPEGGWGYMIGIGMAVSFVVALGPSPSFGIVFGDFLENLGEKTSAITLLNSSYFTSLSFSGLLSNSLFKKFSYRQVGLTGGIFYFTGSLLTIFVTSVPQMLFTFSVLQGMGFGLMIPATFTTFNAYFVQKRAMVMAASQTLIGVGSMCYPFLLQSLMEKYGFRGTLAILAAINAHAILGMVVMQPAEWHLKITEEDIELALTNSNSIDNLDAKIADNLERKKSEPCSSVIREQNIPLLSKNDSQEQNIVPKVTPKGSPKLNSPVRLFQKGEVLARRRGSSIISLGNYNPSTEAIRDSETGAKIPISSLKMLQREDLLGRRRGSSIISLGNYSPSTEPIRDSETGAKIPMSSLKMLQREDLLGRRRGSSITSFGNNHEQIRDYEANRKMSLSALRMLRKEEMIARRRASSIISLGNWTGPIIVSDSGVEKDPKGGWQIIIDFLDLTLLKDIIYVNMVIGVSFAMYSDMTFFTLEPIYLFTLGWSKPDTAICISTGAAADLGSRIFLALFSACLNVSSRNVFLAGVFFSVIGRFGFLFVSGFTGVLSLTAVLGFFRTWIHVPLPLVFAEHFTQDRFPSAYGLFMFLQGIIMFAVGPIIGYIRDATESYIICFHALTVCLLICLIPWSIEGIWLKLKKRPHTVE